MNPLFYDLRISRVQQETPDAVSLYFEVPQDLKPLYEYKQGQYLTLRFNIDGQDVRRAYSMSSSPVEQELAVSVKRVQGGLVSNYIHDKLKAGDKIKVMPPSGRFFTEVDAEQRKTYYIIGAGSGITPLYSILKTVLEREPMSTVHLFYGNRNRESIMYRERLEELERKYADQLYVTHILSQPKVEKKGLLSGIFGKKKATSGDSWQGQVGRINRDTVARYLEQHPPRYVDCEYFICGPEGMMLGVQEVLTDQGIDKRKVHVEYFLSGTPGDGSDDTGEIAAAKRNTGTAATVILNGETHQVSVPNGKTVLDALLDKGVEAPYSCTNGSCTTCIAKLHKGDVEMDVSYGLDPDEVEEGYILTCQAKPTSDAVELTYDI